VAPFGGPHVFVFGKCDLRHDFLSSSKFEMLADLARYFEGITWIRRENALSWLKRFQHGGPGEYRFREVFCYR
jgi:hypothetical protein